MTADHQTTDDPRLANRSEVSRLNAMGPTLEEIQARKQRIYDKVNQDGKDPACRDRCKLADRTCPKNWCEVYFDWEIRSGRKLDEEP